MRNGIMALILGSLVFAGCTEKEQLGADVNQLYKEVKLTEDFVVGSDSVDFSDDEIQTFHAKFQDDVAWKLTVTQQSQFSGATWTLEGTGDVIDQDVFWRGESDELPWFGSGWCEAHLTFPLSSSDTTYSVEFYVVSPPDFDKDAILITDFTGETTAPFTAIGSPTGWNSEWPPNAISNTQFPFPDGPLSPYNFTSAGPWQGFPWGPDTFYTQAPFSPFVDIIRIEADRTFQGFEEYFPLYADPERNFFNVMVYNTPGDYERLQVRLFEENGGERYYDIRPDWEGWKLVSVNYLDFLTDDQILPDPTHVWRLEFLIFSDAEQSVLNTGAAVSVAFDHPAFTFDRPLGVLD